MSQKEKNPFEIKFHNEYVNLIENLVKIFKPDRQLYQMVKASYLSYKGKDDRFTFIHQTIDNLEPYIEAVKEHDESIFCLDTIPTVMLLPNLNFKALWGSPLLEETHKQVVWKYLKNLYILGCHYINRQDKHIREIIDQIKFDKLLKQKVDQEEEDSSKGSKLSDDLMLLFNELFGPDSFMKELLEMEAIKEVITEIKASPINMLKRYMANSGQLVKEKIDLITKNIKEKLMKGELNKDKIDRDMEKVKRIIGKVKGEMPNDPRFKKFFDQLKESFNIDLTSENVFDNPEEIIQQFNSKFEQMSGGVSLEQLASASPEELQTTFQNMTGSDSLLGKVVSELDSNTGELSENLVNIFNSAINSESVVVDSDNTAEEENRPKPDEPLPPLDCNGLPLLEEVDCDEV